MSAPGFTGDVFQNEYLPDRVREVNAIVTVTSAGSIADGPADVTAGAAEIIIIDCSGSMGEPVAKMDQAREATGAAIDAIDDGVAFAVVAGSWRARPVCPPGSAAMSPTTPGRPNSPGPSRTGWRPARRATMTPRPPGWAARWRSPTIRGTRTRPTCWPRWST